MQSKGLGRAHYFPKKIPTELPQSSSNQQIFPSSVSWTETLVTRGQETPRYSLSSGSGTIPFHPTSHIRHVTKSTHTPPVALFFPPFFGKPQKCTQSYFRGTLNYNTKKIAALESPRTADIKVLRAESIFPAGCCREGKPSVGNIMVG